MVSFARACHGALPGTAFDSGRGRGALTAVWKGAEREHGSVTTSVERVAQGLGTPLEVEASCLSAFPMVCLPIAVSLGRLRPDLALGRLGARVDEEEREEGWVAAGEPK